MDRPILESSQVYGGGPYCNPSDHPAERPEDQGPFICGYCNEREVKEDGDICPECFSGMEDKEDEKN